MRHLEIRDLWLQKEVADGRLEVIKLPGTSNPADLMTKHLAEEKMTALLTAAGYEFRDGRAPGAPELTEGAAKIRLAAVMLGLGS